MTRFHWLRKHFEQWFSVAAKRSRKASRPARRRTPLSLESLEDRTVPSGTTLTWTGANSSSWSDPGNWQENQAPQSGYNLVFPTTAISTSSTNDLPGLTLGNIEVDGSYSLSGQAISLTGNINDTAGTTTFGIDATLTGSTTVSVGSGAGLTFQDALGLQNGGSLILGSGTATVAGTLNAPAGTSVQVASGTTLGLSSGANATIGGTMNVTGGTLADAGGTVDVQSGGMLQDTGIVQATNQGSVKVEQQGTYTENGTFSGDSTSTTTIQGSLNAQNAVFQDSGNVAVIAGQMNFNNSQMILDNSTIAGNANTAIFQETQNATVNMVRSSYELNGKWDHVIRGECGFSLDSSSTGTVSNGANVNVTGTGSKMSLSRGAQMTVDSASSVTADSGAQFDLTGSSTQIDGSLSLNGASMTVDATSAVNASGNSADFSVSNSSNLNVTGGSVLLDSGSLMTVDTGSNAAFSSNASFTESHLSRADVAVGATCTINTGAQMGVGTGSSLQVDGSLSLDSAQMTVDGTSSLASSGGTFTESHLSRADLVPGATCRIDTGAQMAVDTGSSLQVDGSLSMDSSQMTVDGTSSLASSGGTFTESHLSRADLVPGATCTIHAGAQMAVDTGSSLQVDGSLSMDSSQMTVDGTSSLASSGGTFTGSHLSRADLVPGATCRIDTGAQMAVDTGSSLQVDGSLSMDSSQMTVDGTSSLASSGGSFTESHLSRADLVPGATCTIHAGAQMAVDTGSSLQVDGSLSMDSSQMTVDGTSSLASSGGTFTESHLSRADLVPGATCRIDTGVQMAVDTGSSLQVDGSLSMDSSQMTVDGTSSLASSGGSFTESHLSRADLVPGATCTINTGAQMNVDTGSTMQVDGTFTSDVTSAITVGASQGASAALNFGGDVQATISGPVTDATTGVINVGDSTSLQARVEMASIEVGGILKQLTAPSNSNLKIDNGMTIDAGGSATLDGTVTASTVNVGAGTGATADLTFGGNVQATITGSLIGASNGDINVGDSTSLDARVEAASLECGALLKQLTAPTNSTLQIDNGMTIDAGGSATLDGTVTASSINVGSGTGAAADLNFGGNVQATVTGAVTEASNGSINVGDSTSLDARVEAASLECGGALAQQCQVTSASTLKIDNGMTIDNGGQATIEDTFNASNVTVGSGQGAPATLSFAGNPLAGITGVLDALSTGVINVGDSTSLDARVEAAALECGGALRQQCQAPSDSTLIVDNNMTIDAGGSAALDGTVTASSINVGSGSGAAADLTFGGNAQATVTSQLTEAGNGVIDIGDATSLDERVQIASAITGGVLAQQCPVTSGSTLQITNGLTIQDGGQVTIEDTFNTSNVTVGDGQGSPATLSFSGNPLAGITGVLNELSNGTINLGDINSLDARVEAAALECGGALRQQCQAPSDSTLIVDNNMTIDAGAQATLDGTFTASTVTVGSGGATSADLTFGGNAQATVTSQLTEAGNGVIDIGDATSLDERVQIASAITGGVLAQQCPVTSGSTLQITNGLTIQDGGQVTIEDTFNTSNVTVGDGQGSPATLSFSGNPLAGITGVLDAASNGTINLGDINSLNARVEAASLECGGALAQQSLNPNDATLIIDNNMTIDAGGQATIGTLTLGSNAVATINGNLTEQSNGVISGGSFMDIVAGGGVADIGGLFITPTRLNVDGFLDDSGFFATVEVTNGSTMSVQGALSLENRGGLFVDATGAVDEVGSSAAISLSSSSSATIDGTLSVQQGAALVSAFTTSLAVDGGTFSESSGGRSTLEGFLGLSGGSLTIDPTSNLFDFGGTIVETSNSQATVDGSLSLGGGTLDVNPGSTIDAAGSSASISEANGSQVVLDGSAIVNQGATLNVDSTSLFDATFSFADVQFNNGGQALVAGGLTVENGAQLNVDPASTVTGDGTNANIQFDTGSTGNVQGNLNANNGAQVNVDATSSTTFDGTAANFNLNQGSQSNTDGTTTLDNGANLTVDDTSTFDATGSNPGAAAVSLAATVGGGGGGKGGKGTVNVLHGSKGTIHGTAHMKHHAHLKVDKTSTMHVSKGHGAPTVSGLSVTDNSDGTFLGTMQLDNGGQVNVDPTSSFNLAPGTISGSGGSDNGGQLVAASTATVTSNGQFNIGLNATFDNGGNFQVDGGLTMDTGSNFAMSGSASCDFGGSASVSLGGTFDPPAGTSLTLSGNAVVTVQSTGSIIYQNLTLQNNSSLTVFGSLLDSSSSILTVSDNASLILAGTTPNSLQGAVSVASGASLQVQSGARVQLANTSSLTNAGTVTVQNGAALDDAGGVTLQSGSALNDSGTVKVESGATLSDAGTLNVQSAPGQVGALNVAGGVSVASGGALTAGGAITVAAGGALDFASGATLVFPINGTKAGTDFFPISDAGEMTLSGATLNLLFNAVSVPGDVFPLIQDTGTTPVTGTFSGLPDGSLLTFGDDSYRLQYTTPDSSGGVDVTLTHIGIEVAPAALPAAVEGQAYSATVATFMSANASAVPSDFTATVDWGDGDTTASVQIVADPNVSHQFDVIATKSNPYAEEGSATVKVTVSDNSGNSDSASSSMTINDAALTASPVTIHATEGVAVSGVTVATFTDADPQGTASDYTATINWGDGDTTAAVQVVADPNIAGQFDVVATKTSPYADEGSKTVIVTVQDSSGTTATANSTTVIADAALTALGQTITPLGNHAFSGQVATFTDGDPSATAADFTATINWGDGHTTTGSVTSSSAGFSVSGTHTYSKVGMDNITVTITDDGGNTATAASTANVVAIQATGTSFSATEAKNFSSKVATFLTASNAAASTFTTTINWGDGQTSPGTLTRGAGGSLSVNGSHSYAEEGNYVATITVSDKVGDTSTASGAATVADAALTRAAKKVSATEAVAFTGVIASFTDANISAAVTDYTATINWGDGQTSTGTVVSTGKGAFNVTGTHTWAEGGNYNVTVSVQDDGGSSATIASSAEVADAKLTATGIPTLTGKHGQTFSGTVATFTDANTGAPLSDFTVTINWGNGVTTTGTVVPGGNGKFTVQGTENYSAPGSFTITVTITDVDGSVVKTTSRIKVT